MPNESFPVLSFKALLFVAPEADGDCVLVVGGGDNSVLVVGLGDDGVLLVGGGDKAVLVVGGVDEAAAAG